MANSYGTLEDMETEAQGLLCSLTQKKMGMLN